MPESRTVCLRIVIPNLTHAAEAAFLSGVRDLLRRIPGQERPKIVRRVAATDEVEYEAAGTE